MLASGLLSIKGRICTLAGLCLATTIATLMCVSLYLTNTSSELAKSNASASLIADARAYLGKASLAEAQNSAAFFEQGQQFGEAVTRQLVQLRSELENTGIGEASMRRAVNDALYVQAHGSNVWGLAMAFTPDAGRDGPLINFAFKGNEKGRFAVYQSANVNSYTMPEKEILNDGTSATAWYNCPMQAGQSCLTDPYSYTDASGTTTMMATVGVPLIRGGQPVGALGVDISFSSLQSRAVDAASSLYGGVSRVILVSPAGTVAADSKSPGNLGKRIAEIDPELATLIKPGLASTQAGETANDMVSLTGFTTAGGKRWVSLVSVPKVTVLAPVTTLAQELDDIKMQSARTQLWVAGLVMLCSLCLIVLLGHSISRPIKRAASMLHGIANGDGDLTQRLEHSRKDEVGALVEGFNQFLDKLQPVIAAITRSVSATRTTASEAANLAAAGNAGMQQQFREIDQVATASQEMTATSHDVANNAAHAANAASNVESATKDGLRAVHTASNAISELARHIDNTVTDVSGLASSSDKIGGVLEVIRSIAEQTNLLALNAAIEAARAGESGRGFAVVADEVRHLAKRTQDSVSEIRGVVERLQNGTHAVVQAMQQSLAQVTASVDQVSQTSQALDRISTAADVINDMNLQIASAAEQQSAVSEAVSKTVLAIRDVTRELTQNSEQAATIGSDLNLLANEQQRLVSGFKA